MPDIRYHFIYFIAVFLMLGIGMMVGASFYAPAQVKQQSKQIAALRVEANQVLQERGEAQDQLAKTEEAVAALRPSLVRGKLSGKRVVVIQTGDDAEATQAAATALSDAGAPPAATVVVDSKLLNLSDKQRAAIFSGLGVVATDTGSATSQGIAPILTALGALLIGGTASHAANQQAGQILEQSGVITITGGDLSEPTSLFVLVSGSKDDGATADETDRATRLDMPLIEQMNAASGGNATIVGCEPYGTAGSVMPQYQQEKIATIDCIDHPLGQLALPFALNGGEDQDDYGLKSTARRTIPASLEEQPTP